MYAPPKKKKIHNKHAIYVLKTSKIRINSILKSSEIWVYMQ